MSPVLDRSAPGVRITLLPDEKASSGEPLDLRGRILGFTFEDSERKADRVSIQLDNFDLSLFDREELAGGAVLEVSWGYPGCMAPPRRVVVKKLKGFATLTVEGQALSALMNLDARTRSWEHVKRSGVARLIAAEHGYEGELADIQDTEEELDTICQTAETDARFLRRLAAREEFEFFVDANGFHWRERRQDTSPVRTFTWYADPGRGDVLSVNVESDLSRRAGKVMVRGRDPLRRATVESSATNETEARATLGEVVEVIDPETGATSIETRNATASVHPTSAGSQGRVRKEASARFRRAERATVKLSLQVVGDPLLQAKSIVEVRGISGYLSGRYYVTDVKHIISSSGYTCELKLVRDGGGQRARRGARSQGGERNTGNPRGEGEMTLVEMIDGETGATSIEYRREGRRIGGGDPEAAQGTAE